MQRWLRSLPYNWEKRGETLRSFRSVLRRRTAHCLEAALGAACILEPHGYPPLLLSFESQDGLDHVLFVFRERGRWGAVARSRDPGLHGRKPVFASPRRLAASYMDAYVDLSGRVTGVRGGRPARAGRLRLAAQRAQRVEGRALADRLPAPGAADARVALPAALARYKRFRARFPDPAVRPAYFDGREAWL